MDPKTIEDFLKSIVNAKRAIVGERQAILDRARSLEGKREVQPEEVSLKLIDVYAADADLWNSQIDLLREQQKCHGS